MRQCTFIILCFLFMPAAVFTMQENKLSIQKLSLDQKIRQLFVIAVAVDENQAQYGEQLSSAFVASPYNMKKEYVRSVVKEGIGGILPLFMSKAQDFVAYVNELQSLSAEYPLLVLLDAERGPAMRIADAPQFPRAMTMGAIQNKDIVRQSAQKKAQILQALGVHIDLGPVADINTDPENPVIGTRSPGDDPERVAVCAVETMHGVQHGMVRSVKSCAKHFPGHGRTKKDSHLELPRIDASREELEKVELYPFKQLITENVAAIMTAHIQVPALDPSGKPASLSYPMVTELLQHQLGFSGLIITDGLGMLGVTQGRVPGEPELEAFKAGNDILLAPVNLNAAIKLIKNYITDPNVSLQERDQRMKRLDCSVDKILAMKRDIFSHTTPCVEWNNVQKAFASFTTEEKQTLYSAAVTIVKNEDDILYKDMSERLVISLFGMNQKKQDNFGITNEELELIKTIKQAGNKKVMTILYGTPYAVPLVKPYSDAIIVVYEDNDYTREAVDNVLLGIHKPSGRLPITLLHQAAAQ